MQDFLFGAVSDVVDDVVAREELRLLAWNLQSPSRVRVERQLEWIYQTRRNVLIFTELKTGAASEYVAKDLASNGFDVHLAEVYEGERYPNLIAVKGFSVRPIRFAFNTPRLTGLRLSTPRGTLDVIALYALTNGMTVESSYRRAAFQQDVVDALSQRIVEEPRVPILVAGDFNVLEPGHVPRSHLFEEHDYAFYSALTDLPLRDAYRTQQPDGRDVSWCGPHGGQRLDHAFVSSVLTKNLTECQFDHTARTSGLSDHSALTLTLALN